MVRWAAAGLHSHLEELEGIAGGRAGRLEHDLFERTHGDGVSLPRARHLSREWRRHGKPASPHLKRCPQVHPAVAGVLDAPRPPPLEGDVEHTVDLRALRMTVALAVCPPLVEPISNTV
jgi:hypothetical protein